MQQASWNNKNEPFVIFGLFILAIVLFVVVLRFGTYNIGRERKDVQFGVTFSKLQAESLRLDWRKTYVAVLDDLKVGLIRVPVYWNDVEKKEGEFRFDDYHWMFFEAQKRGVQVIPVLGMRVPRWPECHIPLWAERTNQEPGTTKSIVDASSTLETTPEALDKDQYEYNQYLQSKVITLLEKEVNEFKEYSNILYWQVENEPLLKTFGICPFNDLTFTMFEFEQVKSLDPKRKTMGTESGEMSSWLEMSQVSDVLGASLYRITFNPLVGFFYYPIPPLYYQKKSEYISHLVDKVIISELQAEPWVEGDYVSVTPEYLQGRFPLSFMRDNVSFSRKTQSDTVLLWGVEWWEYMRQQGISEYWDYAKTLF